MRCPQCNHDQRLDGAECERCGIVFARVNRPQQGPDQLLRCAEPGGGRPDAATPRGIDAAGRRAAAIGFGLAALTQLLPLLQMLIQYMVVLVHELGHAAVGWLFGFPSIPAFDFVYGGGVTSHTDRSVLVVIGVLGVAGYGLWHLRSHRTLFRAGCALVATYLLLLALGGDSALIVAMGHGAELLFAGLFFFRALSGSGCHLEAERPLYAWLGWHIVWFDLLFAWGLMTSGAERANYGAAKGGGHWMDFSRLAGETFGVSLATIAFIFALLCFLPLPAAWWLASKKNSNSNTLTAS